MISKITPLLMILVIASILGYMTENIWVGLRFGYWDNRGMMMPGLLGYGMAIVGLYLILGLPQKPMLFGHEFFFENSLQGIVFYYVAAGVLVSVAEIVLGNFVELYGTAASHWQVYLRSDLDGIRSNDYPIYGMRFPEVICLGGTD